MKTCWINTLAATVLLLACSGATAQEEERPTAMRLFPAETVLFLRTPDATLMFERMAATNTGKLLEDPELSGLMTTAGQELTDAYNENVGEVLGVDLADLRRLPQGEVAFGLIERSGKPLAVALLADFRDSVDVAEQVFERLQELATEGDQAVMVEQLRNDKATLVRGGNNQNRVLAVVQRKSTYLIANDRDVLQSMLDRWDGLPATGALEEGEDDEANEEESSDETEQRYTIALADSATFADALRECLPGREEPPQAIFFADPIGILRATAGRQGPVRIAMATFPALGLDGVRGFAGAMWFATEKWESLTRGHLLLDNPRAGVMKIARLEPGDPAPPPYAPADLETVFVSHADPMRMFGDIERLVDRFRYEGSLQEAIDNNLSKRLGLDVKAEVIENLAGHAYMFTGYNPDQTDIHARSAFALQVKDPDKAKAFFAKIAEKFPQAMRLKSHAATEYYALGPEREKNLADPLAQPTPAVGVVSDAILFASGEQFFTRFVDANDGVADRFVDSLTYRLVASRLARLSGAAPPSLALYEDSEASIRHWHQILSSDSMRSWLGTAAESNPALKIIHATFGEDNLPPLETLLKYTAPSGGVIYDTPTGFHMIGFGFKRGG